MFKKKICTKCGNKVNNKYEFCPYCGNKLTKNFREQDWGMLGKDDSINSINEIKFPKALNTIFNSLMKNLNKQFSELSKEKADYQSKTNNKKENPVYKSGISISISSSGNRAPEIRIKSLGGNQKLKQQEEIKKTIINNFSKKNLKKISGLPRQEPLTNIRRLSNKIVYEIKMPGVNSMKDVSIIKLENSIEIKALAKDKVYFKLIPINLPIRHYNFSKEKLILELGIKN